MSGLGIKALCGIGKQNAFATSVVASYYLAMLSESLKAGAGIRGSDFFTGGAAKEFIARGLVACGGSLPERVPYLLSTDPLNPLLEQAFGRARGHVYRKLVLPNPNTVSWIPLRIAATDNQMLAFNFTPAVLANGGVGVQLRLRRRGALASGAGVIQVHFDGDTAGNPDETPITNGSSATLDVGAITKDDGGQMVDFTYATSPSLAAGTPRHARLVGTYTASATDNIEVACESVGSGGNLEIKDVSWADDATKNVIGRILTTTFQDSYLLADSIEGLFATAAIDKQTVLHELAGLKVRSLELASEPEGLRASYDLVGYDEVLAPVNTALLLAGLKLNALRQFPIHSDLTTVWLGDQADALQASDAFKVSALSLRIERPLDNVAPSGQLQILEPLETGHRMVRVEVTVPRYTVDTFRTWQSAATALQLKAVWTNGSRYAAWLLPHLRIEGPVAIDTTTNPYAPKITLTAFANKGLNPFLNIQDEAEFCYLNT